MHLTVEREQQLKRGIFALIDPLKRPGVSDDVINEALTDIVDS
ncbi:hypothetical protein [Tolypothrix tenuis]